MPNDHSKVIYVCSALAGDIPGNMQKAADYCRFVTESGFIPYAPHLLFTQFLDDNIPADRALAGRMSTVMLDRVDELWIFSENGRISTGMHAEIDLAKNLSIPINYFDIEEKDTNKNAMIATARVDPRSALSDEIARKEG